MALVALPVMGLAGAAVFAQSHVATPAQKATMQLGQTQSWIEITGGPDPSRVQAVDEPYATESDTDPETGTPTHPEQPAPTSIDGAVPAGTRTIEIVDQANTRVTTATGIGAVAAVTGPAWDPVFTGRYTIIDGAAPASDHEAMVTPGLLKRLGVPVGGTVTLPDQKTSFTITGTMRELDQDPGDDVVYLPASARGIIDGGQARWYMPDWQPSYEQLGQLNRAGYVAFARGLAINPPAGAKLVYQLDQSYAWTMLTIGAIAAAFCGYLVVLLAGAAFAVAARRQQRALAMVASVGAGRGDVFRVVVLQGTVLGFAGGVVGTLLGAGLAIGALTVGNNGVVGSFWGGWGIQVPWWLLIAIIVFAVIVGTLASIVPARGATRGDVLAALRGARRPPTLNPRRPLWGLLLMAVGVATTIGGALGLTALNAAPTVQYDNPWRTPLLISIIAGPLLFQVGFIVGGHWILTMISRALSRLGLAPRLASRDAAANRSRVIPAFAAIAACVFLATFVLSMTAVTQIANSRNYAWSGHLGAVTVNMWGDDLTEHGADYVAAAEDLLAPTHPTATALVRSAPDVPFGPGLPDPPADARVWTMVSPEVDGFPADCTTCDPRATLGYIQGPAVVAPEDLSTILGVPIPAKVLDAYRNGAGLVTGTQYGLRPPAPVRVIEWTPQELADYQSAADKYMQGAISASEIPVPATSHKVPTVLLDTPYPQGGMSVWISPATAKDLGMTVAPSALYAVYPQPPGTDVTDALTAGAEGTRVGNGSISIYVEHGPDSISPWLWLITGVTMALVLGAGAVCLGLARFERRADDATLSAVGGGRGIRRGVNAWQAVIVVGIGTVVGTAAGLIPSWGVTKMSSDLQFADVPWLWLGILAIGLPAVMAAASWLIPPRAPDLTRRTAIA